MRIDKIPDDAVLIKGTVDDYVDPRGNIYGYNHRNNQERYPYIKEMQTVFGYSYVPINYVSGRKTRRAHRIVAEAFIPNPNNYPIVMHIDNDKKNNRVENLRWGTNSENTRQAFDDGLVVNAKGYEDSQSTPCDMYSTTTNKLIASYGSCCIAAEENGYEKSTVMRQVKNSFPEFRKEVYFTRKGDGPRDHQVIVQYDFQSDKVLGVYINCGDAAKKTGLAKQTINESVNLGRKPKWCASKVYFKRMYLKGEEIIEIDNESRVGRG